MIKKFKLYISLDLDSGDIVTVENKELKVLPRPWYIRFIHWISCGKWCKKDNCYTVKIIGK
jgi:hypothetical protein